MPIDDYTAPPPTADYTPRPDASKQVARAKRERGDSEPSAQAEGVAIPRQWLVAALFGGMLLFVLALWQLAQPARPLALTPVPTQAAPTESASSLSVKRAQEGPQETISATLAPRVLWTAAPAPAEAVLAAPQTGRGLGAVATPEPQIAPSYIENVGAQAEHCIRTCDGQPGPNGGDWALAPTAEPAMLEVIGRQAPHKIR